MMCVLRHVVGRAGCWREVVWVLWLEGGLGLQRWVWQAGACAAV